MTHHDNKFLLDLVSNITPQQLFFFTWAGIVAVAVVMMNAYYKKSTRRNFRPPGDPGPRIDVHARRLGDGTAGKQIVPQTGSKPPSK